MPKPVSKEDDSAADSAEDSACTFTRKQVKKMASTLSAVKVTRVSIVGHAANGMSFGIMKSEDGSQPDTPLTPMSKAIPAFGTAGAQLNRIEFSSEHYKDEAAVQAYLTASNIESNRPIEKTETGFLLPGVHADSFEADSIAAVKGDKDGVTYHIGRLKAPVASRITPPSPNAGSKTVTITKDDGTQHTGRVRDDDEAPAGTTAEATPAATGEEADALGDIVVKMDTWVARQSGTQTFDETMKAGETSLPGFYDIQDALSVTIRNIIAKAGASEAPALIQAAYTRAGEITSQLASLFITIQKSDKGENVILNRTGLAPLFSSPAAPVAGVVTKTDASPAPGATAEPEAPEGGKTGEKQEDEPEESAIEKAVAKALAPLAAKVEAVATVAEEVKKTAESVHGLEARVAGNEGVRVITRKASPDDGTPASEETPVQKAEKAAEAVRVQKKEQDAKELAAWRSQQAKSRMGFC